MKTILLLLTVFITGMSVVSCTNDEGEENIDVITPNEEESINESYDVS